MNDNDMLMAFCRGHSCHECKLRENNINCVAIHNNRASEDQLSALKALYDYEFLGVPPVEIAEEDIEAVFRL